MSLALSPVFLQQKNDLYSATTIGITLQCTTQYFCSNLALKRVQLIHNGLFPNYNPNVQPEQIISSYCCGSPTENLLQRRSLDSNFYKTLPVLEVISLGFFGVVSLVRKLKTVMWQSWKIFLLQSQLLSRK